ncbi:MAG: hypothetical protein UY61_C0069G0002 [Candidatus Adlerbacteria bacterium GW2011_GWC1_50_9]|uniref:Uncharacterized protein n=1 Tax=Candidatus Adlerbacteria bacterium GW2011_GWC1_50_9 TaxID=1618608 RepID=A0A0G1WJI4_9BACT|nr:MAG: hypothetical protein UY61_C0069G0002 [Candidatus Adlerbacteria bacterium GW2011_GWC1_50_9]
MKEKEYVLVYRGRGENDWGGTSFSTPKNLRRQSVIRKAEKICGENKYRPALLFLSKSNSPFIMVYDWGKK